MKKFAGLTLLLLITLGSFSQYNSEYMTIMVKQTKALPVSTTVPSLKELANNFERIANAESNQWHPLYYPAFCYENLSFLEKDTTLKDEYLDKAQHFIDKALEIYPEESELFVIQGLLYQGIIQINPGDRLLENIALAGEAFNKAISFNPDNPRAYYLIGLNFLYSRESLGGGAEAACPFFQTAIEKFSENIPEHVLSHTWGREENYNRFNKNCNDID